MNSKPEFLETKFSPKNDYSKSFVFDIFRDDKFSIQNLTKWKIFNSKSQFLGKTLHHNLILFFERTSLQTLIFNEKICFRTKLFKTSTKSENSVAFLATNWIKTIFFSDMNFSSKSFSSKIELKTSSFEISFSLKCDYSKSSLFNIFLDNKFSIQNLTCWIENLRFWIEKKISIQNLFFWEKVWFIICFFFSEISFWKSDF